MNPTTANERKRTHHDEEPEKDSLKERSNPDLTEVLMERPVPIRKSVTVRPMPPRCLSTG
jgi:hypothetical protein